jgi:myo-inositol-1(or 4)-monophosphatase
MLDTCLGEIVGGAPRVLGSFAFCSRRIRVMNVEIEWLLNASSELHAAARSAVSQRTSLAVQPPPNRKGDIPDASDLTADSIVRRFLREHFPLAAIISEEGEDELGNGSESVRFVIDPVDGTDNFRRNLPGSTLCVAACSPDIPVSVDSVKWAIVGDYASPHPIVAIRGQGVWRDGRRVNASSVTRVSEACLHFELNQHARSRVLTLLFEQAQAVRSYCGTAYAICLVAQGSLDAHIDIRQLVTPESYLAASLILTEAGGVIVNEKGNPLEPFRGLTDQRSIVAAATPELAAELSSLFRS